MSKGNYHPSRISQRQKLARQRAYDELHTPLKKANLKPLDTTSPNWSIKL